MKSAAEIARIEEITSAPAFLDSTTLAATFLTDPSVVREILPPPLEPAADPRVSVAVYQFAASNCVGPFSGASVDIACSFDGQDGFYCLTMPMSTDTAVIFGRELYAEPKKLADCRLEQRGRFVHGSVTRHGVTCLEITGLFEEPLREVERTVPSAHYYFKHLPAASGQGLAFDPQLVRVTHTARITHLTRGAATIILRESRHDPLIDIPVLEVESATFSRGEIHTRGEVVATVPAQSFLPWAFAKQDDLTAWAPEPEAAGLRRPSAPR